MAIMITFIYKSFHFELLQIPNNTFSQQREMSKSMLSTIYYAMSFQNLLMNEHCQNKSSIVSGYISHNEQLAQMPLLNLRR